MGKNVRFTIIENGFNKYVYSKSFNIVIIMKVYCLKNKCVTLQTEQ